MEEEQKILGSEEKQELLAIYKITEERRRHYDTLAWAVGAVVIPLSIYMFRLALVELRTRPEYIIPVGIMGIILFLFWHAGFDRLGKHSQTATESIYEIENRLKLTVKPGHHHGRKKDLMNKIDEFRGFGDYFSLWSLRWLLFSVYSFIWIIIWLIKLKGMEFGIWALLYLLIPVVVLIYLNITSLLKKTLLKLNPRFISVIFTAIWFAIGLVYLLIDALRSIPSLFALLITR